MKKKWLLAIAATCLLWRPAAGLAKDLTKADGLFDKGLYQEALHQYEAALKDPAAEIRLKALYRAVESRALLFRYADAAKLAFGAQLPSDLRWKSRFLILRAEIAREFLKQYGSASPKDVEEGNKDLSRRTPEEWRGEARSAYRQLRDLRRKLIKIPLREEGYFVDLRDAEVEAIPTLWDFAALRWSEFLLDEEESPAPIKPAALSFLDENYTVKLSSEDGPAAQAAALFEDASALGGDGRSSAQEVWKITRLKIPFDHPGLVTTAPDEEGFANAAIKRLMGWFDAFSTPLGRAEAGLFAAKLLTKNSRFSDALGLCQKVETNASMLSAAKHCANLRAQFELPVLSLSAKFVPPGSRDALRVRTRNLDEVFFRLYRANPEELLELAGQYPAEGWSRLRQADEKIVAHFLNRAPDHAWTASVRSTEPYAFVDTDIKSPTLNAGIYLALAGGDESFKPGSSLLNAVYLNVTDLFLIASSGVQGPERDFIFEPSGPSSREAPILHFYTLNGLTGKPTTARIDAFRYYYHQKSERVILNTDSSGRAQASADIDLNYGSLTQFLFDPLAKQGESYAYGSGALYFGASAPAPIEIFVETDRPIYRPGQEVRAKVTVLRRIPRGYRVYDGTSVVRFQARDVNNQELFKADLKLNAMGSAQTKFTIPAGRLLGEYRLSAELKDFNHDFSSYQSFSVEEYKRPEFEVEVEEATAPWKFGQAASVLGTAKYYFGGAVPDAPVTYRIYRESYIPWFCWWWRGLTTDDGRTEVLTGQTMTDAEGRFSFTFTPEPADTPQEEPWPATFVVEAESRDPGGRTIQASRSFRAGAKSYLFDIAPASGFLLAGKASEIPIRLMSLNENPVTGSGSFELRLLSGRPMTPKAETRWDGSFPDGPSLEALFKDVDDGPLIAQGNLIFTGKVPAKAALKGLKEGVYRLKVRAEDTWGGINEQSIVLLAASGGRSKKALELPEVTIAEHASYIAGETANVLMGSSLLDGTIHIEIWGGQHLLERRVLNGGGIRMLSVPVGDDHKGGFTVRWFGARDFNIRSGQVHIDVPWKDRELSVKLKHTPVMKPGEKVTWSLSVVDRDKKPVQGEAVVRVFDRSLEYYVKAMAPWVSQLFAPRRGAGSAQGSLYEPWTSEIPIEEGWIKKMLERYDEAIAELQPPMLRLNKSRVYDFSPMSESFEAAAGSPSPKSVRAGTPHPSPGIASRKAQEREYKTKILAEPPSQPPVHVRSDFSETAFFEPQLNIADGRGVFSFKAPEQLTSWKIQAYALTKDAKRGEVSAEALTRKDLMVQVEMPRFFREGDEGIIKTVVHNETDQNLAGELTLAIEEDGKNAAEKLGLSRLTQNFASSPRGIAPLSWKIKAPRGSTDFKVRAIARSGNLTDAEERDLPILPSRERLVESVIVTLDGSVKKALRLPAFYQADPTRVNESMTLQVDPQLALSILNSLPFLAHYPHECVEQLLNRTVPLAIVNSFYKKNPELAKAEKRIPKRDSITPAWDRGDPRRMIHLMETPWEEISAGRKSYWPVIDMLDDAVVKRELEDSLGKLKTAQNPDGGFPWFPGGRSDPYITLLVLSGFAEAQNYGVEVPADIVNRALGYVNQEMPKHLKPDEGDVSLILYAAYVVTSYPKNFSGAGAGWKFAKIWADTADKHAEAMTPLGKAYAAFVYWRLGEKAKGDLYLDRALDGARQDPIAGVYWTPEKISWLWYNDTVEKHAFLLRALLTLRPKDGRIPGMVQWLLFNRKGNEWKSTKASAAAIFSLLDVLRSRGALDTGDNFQVNWGADVETARVEPYDWLEKPLRWTKRGMDIGVKQGAAAIQKDGPGLAFASLTWIYTTDQTAKASGPGMMELSRRFFLRSKKADGYHLSPLKAGEEVNVGDQIEIQLKLNTRGQFEYAHLKDPKIAGFEAEELLSGWKWDQLSRYEEPRDSLTNFFIPWLPHGEHILRYRVRPTTAGRYRLGAAVLQSMYAPEMAAHSNGFQLNVIE